MKRSALFHALSLLILLAAVTAGPVLAQEGAPAPDIVLVTASPSIVAEKGGAITFALEVVNSGKVYREVALKTPDAPADWSPLFRQSGTTVRSVMVAPGKSLGVDLQLKPAAGAAAQDYAFTVQGSDRDGKPLAELRLSVGLHEKAAAGGLKATTQYPEAGGQAGSTVSFRISVSNDADQDRSVGFSAKAPQGWQVTFKPAFDSRQVTVISMRGGATQDLDVDVAVPRTTEAGPYQLTFTAAADRDTATVPLNLTVSGNSALSLSTASGQLNTRASIDQVSKMAFVVRNTGTAPLQNVSLNASTPDGWEVTFQPDRIDNLPIDQSMQVNADIKPSGKALTGDYMVSVTAAGGAASDNTEIRVTVETPATWGWAAIAAIVIVVGGLGAVFARFSRR